MLFPKLKSIKTKLSLTEKMAPRFDELTRHNSLKQEEKQIIFRNSRIIQSSKHQIQSLSSSLTKDPKFFRHSIISRKVSSNEKQKKENLRVSQNDNKIQTKSILKLNKCIKSSQLSPEKSKSQKSNSTSQIQIVEETLKMPLKSFLMQYESSYKKDHQVDDQIEIQDQFQFDNCQNTKIVMTQSQNPKLNSQSQRTFDGVRSCRKKVSIESFTLQSSLISIKIEPQSSLISEKKRLMIETLIEDQDFEWKYQKFKEYIQKYSEFEIKLKQNFEMLQLLTDNIELLKQRIIPCKEYTVLKEIIDLVKPSITKKQQKAIEIKTSMIQWKKKFFSSLKKNKCKLNDFCQQESRKLRFRLQDNQELAQKTMDIINQSSKKGNGCLQKEKNSEIKNYLQTILLNQKQMIDDTQIFEINNEGFVQKIDLLEEEWTRAFDIFNFTLENCAKKSIILSETIENFYGKCSTAAFLTKGFEPGQPQDQRLLQNEKCSICRWNEIKLKKIIEQNSSTKEHLIALKHLVAR